VLKGLNLGLDMETIAALANARPGAIDGVLWSLKEAVTARPRQKEAPHFEDTDLAQIDMPQ
jgi:hypothetical protein